MIKRLDREDAKAFLRHFLTSAPDQRLPSAQLRLMAQHAGISWSTLCRASVDLPIVARQQRGAPHGGWCWQWVNKEDER